MAAQAIHAPSPPPPPPPAGATYVNSRAGVLSEGTPEAFPAGYAAGQIIIVTALDGGGGAFGVSLASGNPLTLLNTASTGDGWVSKTYWAILAAGDVASPNITVSGTSGGSVVFSIALYSGVTSLSFKETVTSADNATDITFSSHAPAANSLGWFIHTWDSGFAGALSVAATGWTTRMGGTDTNTYFTASMLEQVPAVVGAVTITGYSASYHQFGKKLEFLGP